MQITRQTGSMPVSLDARPVWTGSIIPGRLCPTNAPGPAVFHRDPDNLSCDACRMEKRVHFG